MFLIIVIFIFSIIGLIAGIFSAKDYFNHVKSWKTLKQINDEYMSCLFWGWISLMCIVICSLSIILSVIAIFSLFFVIGG